MAKLSTLDKLLLERERRRRALVRSETLYQYIRRVSPHWAEPRWLDPIVQVFHRIDAGESVRALFAAPPQHGKSELIKHGLTWLAGRHPDKTNIYASFQADRARQVNAQMLNLARRAGHPVTGNSRIWGSLSTHLDDAHAGGVYAVGMGGMVSGFPCSGVFAVDDPTRGWRDANSSVIREHGNNWFGSEALTRVHPKASALVIQTRWNPADLSGTLQQQTDEDGKPLWEVYNLPAWTEIGNGERRALWEDGRPLKWLDRRRREIQNEYIWEALYMGRPRPRGSQVFVGTHTTRTGYEPASFRVGIGLDFAYAEKKEADHSVAVVLGECDGKYYVLEVVKVQVKAPGFAQVLARLNAKYPYADWGTFAYGPEKGTIDFIAGQLGVDIEVWSPGEDKLARAQPAAYLWNTGAILVPGVSDSEAVEQITERLPGYDDPQPVGMRGTGGPDWLDPFLATLHGFTGIGDEADDEVDALAGAVRVLQGPAPATFDAAYDKHLPTPRQTFAR